MGISDNIWEMSKAKPLTAAKRKETFAQYRRIKNDFKRRRLKSDCCLPEGNPLE